MKLVPGIIISIALVVLHGAALYAVLHPKVSRGYRAYYIDRTTTDWNVQHYHASPEEGIQFAQPGWPDFVSYSMGISNVEGFGRWTDTRLGLKAGFEFQRSFSGPVCVVVRARPADALRGKPVAVVFGEQEQPMTLAQGNEFQNYSIDFSLNVPATMLVFRFPAHLPRASHANPRQPGLALQSIQIFSERCSDVSGLVNNH